MQETKMKPKLSEIYKQDPTAQLLIYEVRLISAHELVERILDDPEDGVGEIYTAVHRTWTPSARSMWERYLENEDEEMYEGFYENINGQFTSEVIEAIQICLDRAMEKKPGIGNYWMSDQEVENDIGEVSEQQHIRWLELLDEAGIWHHLSEEGIDFKDAAGKEAAYKLARENGLHLIVDDEA